MENLSDEYKRNFSVQLYKLYQSKDWVNARRILGSELKKYPEEYYLLIELSTVLIRLNLKGKALKYVTEAYSIEPNDAMVIYYYSDALYENKFPQEAINYLEQIFAMNFDDIAYGDYGEGYNYALSTLNDSRYLRALCLIDLNRKNEAVELINLQLENRRRGLFSIFKKNM